MIELGKVQRLVVVRIAKVGAYLDTDSEGGSEGILLPMKQVPLGIRVGDEIEVFVYRDSEDRMIATTNVPKITIGELAKLRVVDNSRIGAFLDWGLDKDLLLPFKQQTREVEKGAQYLVGLYLDKSNRLCATMDIHRLLSAQSPYKGNEWVRGTIYKIIRDIGAFVAVEDKYDGLIPNNEFYGNYNYGDKVEVRIKRIKEDGKLELSLRKEAYSQMEDDAEMIFERLLSGGGKLPLNDKSRPEDIYAELGISKASFKRAVGRLLKERKITITEDGIERV